MTFPARFLLCNIFISILLVFLLFTKKILKKHITLKTQYYLWYIFVFSLFLPFFPRKSFTSDPLFLQIQQWFSENTRHLSSVFPDKTSDATLSSVLELHDYSTAIASSHATFHIMLWTVWVGGMVFVAMIFACSMMKIYLLRKKAYHITEKEEPDLYNQFSICLKQLGILRKVSLYASCNLSSPISYGLIRPTVIIPRDLDILLSEEDVYYIFLHELQHYRQKDPLLNHLVCLLQIIYWFNPFMWYGFHQLQKDREIACDNSVLCVIGKENSINYGCTIIKYARHMQNKMIFSLWSAMGGSKDTIKQRIIEIADYKKDSGFQKIKSAGAILLMLLLVYCSSPLYTVYASPDISGYSFHPDREKWETLNAAAYFNGEEGSFVLYDMTKKRYQIYNKNLSEKRISPDSTFKIYSGLFALEENIISPNTSLLKWDKSPQPFDSWNQDQTLDTAMKDSVNWYFQNLDSRLGLTRLYTYYRKISYGNCDLTGGAKQYWAESSLKISPAEQVALLSDLLQNKWHFKEQNIRAIKNSLFIAATPAGKLYGKTGTGSVDGKNVNGWFVGFLENEDGIFCFAANLQDSENCTGAKASEITINILNNVLSK